MKVVTTVVGYVALVGLVMLAIIQLAMITSAEQGIQRLFNNADWIAVASMAIWPVMALLLGRSLMAALVIAVIQGTAMFTIIRAVAGITMSNFGRISLWENGNSFYLVSPGLALALLFVATCGWMAFGGLFVLTLPESSAEAHTQDM